MLTIVSLVLQHKCPTSVDYALGILSDLLVADMSITRACALTPVDSLCLLNLVWDRSLQNVETSRWSLTKLLQTESHYFRWEFSRAMVEAIRRGDRRLVQWLMDHFQGCPISDAVIETAAGCGHLWVLQLLEADERHGEINWRELHEDRFAGEIWCEALHEAAKNKHWEVVRWLDKRVSTTTTRGDNTSVVAQAILQQDLKQLKWAFKAGFALDYFACIDLYEEEWRVSSKIIKYLFQVGYVEMAGYALEQAAESGDLELVKWLTPRIEIDDTLSSDEHVLASAVKKASEYGHLATAKWLLSHIDEIGAPYDSSEVMFMAAMGGNLELVQWLYAKYSRDSSVDLFRCQPESEEYIGLLPVHAMDAAAKSGGLEVVQFLDGVRSSILQKRKRQEDGGKWKRRRNPKCTSLAMDAAAERGRLEVVKWLHVHRSEGCTKEAIDRAAANGHVEVVKWLVANRDEGCTRAAMDGIATMTFHDKKDNCHSDTGDCCRHKEPSFFAVDQLEFLKWFHTNCSRKCSSAAMDGAATNGNLKMLQWLHENTTAGCTRKAMNSAAAAGRLDVVKWLCQNRSENCPSSALDSAAAKGHLRVVQWLVDTSTGLDIMSSMKKAFSSRQFDVTLCLYEHVPNDLSDDLVNEMKASLGGRSAHEDLSTREIRAWLNEKYPRRDEQ